MWAFNYEREQPQPSPTSPCSHHIASSTPPSAEAIWSAIPLDTDIVLTHTPPHNHCDESARRRRATGCESLRRALWRVRPRLAVCGHVHDGRGAERVRWNIEGGSHAAYMEASLEKWEDPGAGQGNKKISLVDLTGRGGRRALVNDGGSSDQQGRSGSDLTRDAGAGDASDYGDGTALPGSGTLGVGGDPTTSLRCDRAALYGRMGRRETCIVNCAIVATSFPHTGGKRFNKPIVVDLDLPVWESDESESTQP